MKCSLKLLKNVEEGLSNMGNCETFRDCEVHQPMQELVTITANNVVWFKQIGKWIIGLLGALIGFVVPALIVFFIHLADINTRIIVLEGKVDSIYKYNK